MTDWEPLLTGDAADRAREIVHGIADALEHHPPVPRPGLKGDAVIAYLLALLERTSAIGRLEAALAAATSEPQTMALFGGIAGTAWIVEQILDEDELRAYFDVALAAHLAVPQWQERHDLMSGLAGVGVYAIGRDRELAERVLGHLEAIAEHSVRGTTWRTPPAFLPLDQRALHPDGKLDLGVAHGVPGIIGVLARYIASGVEVARARRLLDGGLAWLAAMAKPESPCFDPRVGWCHGDLGIGGVLIAAGQAIEDPALVARGVALLHGAARMLAEREPPDAGFCHGTAGFAHVFNAAYQRTGDRELREHALRWLAATMRFRRPGIGIAGYQTLQIDGEPRWTSSVALLGGVVGTALVLLAATEPREPAWQQLFVL